MNGISTSPITTVYMFDQLQAYPNTPVYKDVQKTNWSTDATQNLTGNKRDIIYKYRAYKMEYDEKGDIVFIPSEYVDNIYDVCLEYPYFKINDFYTTEYSDVYYEDKILIK